MHGLSSALAVWATMPLAATKVRRTIIVTIMFRISLSSGQEGGTAQTLRDASQRASPEAPCRRSVFPIPNSTPPSSPPRPLDPDLRDPFLRPVANALEGREVRPG